MKIIEQKIICIDPDIFQPDYYHPDGKFLITIAIQETYDTGGTCVVHTHRGFWNLPEAENWIERHYNLVCEDPNHFLY